MKRIASGNPLRKTRWIWPEAYMYLYNSYAQFRRDFELGAVPRKAPFFITADKAYKLYVNGQYVCRGPARGYQSHWPCDQVDLAPFLREGHNWLAVEGYNPGISTFQYLHKNLAGLLCAPAGGKLAEAWEKSKWLMRRDPARATQTAKLSLQIDFQEHIDLAKDDRKWITDEKAPENWRAELFPDGAHNYMGFPFGMPPFDDVEERGIPALAEPFAPLAGASAHGVGRNGENYRECKNVDWAFIHEVEAQKIVWDDGSCVKTRKDGDVLEIEVEPAGENLFRAITIFNGEYSMGCLEVEVPDARGGELLDFKHYQYLRDGKPKFIKPGGGCLVALGNRLKLRAGANKHEFFHPIASGHFTLIARDLKATLKVRLRLRRVEYPFSMKGGFACSDAALGKIYEACRRTQRLCSLDAYVDTPWREQAQWWGDARVQARNTFHLDGDARLLARGVESIAGQELQTGLTAGHAPTSGTWCILPDFTITWMLTIWDYWMQTGDLSLFKRMLPRVKKALAYFDSKEARAENGLLKHDGRFWLFEDWSPLPKDVVPTFLNLWLCIGYEKVAELLNLVGRKADAAKLLEKKAKLEKLLVEKLFDASTGLFLPCLDAAMKPAGEPSVHDQTMALMLGLKPEAHEAMIEKTLLPFLRGAELKGAKASAFWSTYVIQEMMKRGYGEDVLAFIRRNWEPMTSTGTCWEDYKWDETQGSSACHAWTAHPSSHFVNLLGGIEQAAPAWAKVSLKPFYAKDIDFVKAAVPTPKGMVELEWRRANGAISGTAKVPQGVEVELVPGEAKIDLIRVP